MNENDNYGNNKSVSFSNFIKGLLYCGRTHFKHSHIWIVDIFTKELALLQNWLFEDMFIFVERVISNIFVLVVIHDDEMLDSISVTGAS